VERGLFEPDDRIELIDGLLIVREPQSAPHLVALQLAQRALQRAFGDGWNVRPAGPVALDEDSEPEPDLAVVPGDPRDYVGGHPARPSLVVEVSLTRLAFDREYKASLYARAAIVDYWIVNLVDRVLEVYREPVVDPSAIYGWHYRSVTSLTPQDFVAPLAFTSVRIVVSDLLP
jgi:Uma2 family endonuclease